MNLLLIDHAPFFGGSESFLIDLLSTLDRRAYTPIIVSDTRSPVLDRLRAAGDPVLTTPFPRINRSPAFAWRLMRSGWRLAQLARRAQADLLHTFTARTHLIGAVAARVYRMSRAKAPTIVFFHGGGWVAGDIETHDRQARLLAIEGAQLLAE